MSKLLDGKKIASEITQELKAEVEQLREAGVVPTLANIGYKPDARSLSYIKMKAPQAASIGVDYTYYDLSNKSQQDCLSFIAGLAQDKSIHGIIVQMPIHDWYDPQMLLNIIPVEKDVDGLSDQSLLNLQNNEAKILPATPLAILELLKRSDVELQDKTVTLVGQGKLVGLPLSFILRNMGIKVLTADATTVNLAELTRQADVIVSATGQPNLITAKHISQGCVVVDAGIVEVNGKPKGDVEYESVKDIASMISPVPGGVGPVTVSMLLSNVVTVAKDSL